MRTAHHASRRAHLLSTSVIGSTRNFASRNRASSDVRELAKPRVHGPCSLGFVRKSA